MAVGYNPRVVTDGLVLALDAANPKSYDSAVRGQQTYTSSGSYSWTCPSGVTSVSVVCIGGGGGGNGGGTGVGGAGGGGGGGLGYKNNISVTPGQSYTVVVGAGGAGDAWDGPPYSDNPANDGGDSYFISANIVKGGGGGGGLGNSSATGGSGGTYVGDGGGNGYSGGTGSGSASLPATGGGGGSTGNYTGNATTRGTSKYISSNCTSGCLAGNGTGQGLLGTGSSGSYGRGGGANMETFANGNSGYFGAVRIMWGPDRSYPSTGVADQSTSTVFGDISGKGNNGTLTNGPTFDSGNGGAIVFDGTNEYVTIPDSEDLEFGSGDFTIEAYIYPTGVPSGAGFACIFAKGAPLQCYFMNSISLNSLNSLSLYVDTNNDGTPYSIIDNNNITGNNTVNQDEWTHIAICRSGDTWKVFTGGVQRYSATHSGAIFNNTDVFSIGDYGPSSGLYPFQGRISNFKVYKGKALTAAEVLQNYNATKGRYV